MIIRIILIVILALFLCFFIFRDNSLKRNVSALWSLGIIAVCVIILFILIMGLIKKYKGIGEGALFTDMISTNSSSDETGSVVTDLAPGSSAVTGDGDENNPAGGGELTVRVSGDTVYIGNEEYKDVNLVRPAINEAAKNGAAVILVDDYASARTYIEVKDLLSELGVTDMTEETLD
ncbi:hypothetical protein SAMN02910292_00513 [Lachnospiraceae bacterium XBB2008]|nr:hypothetical protein SAMN02910292_00513 [Lachnospiraceae bacterium XBB2008]